MSVALRISDQSVHNILGESQTAMVYGFEHCKYSKVAQILQRHQDVSNIYNWALGDESGDLGYHGIPYQRIDGEPMCQVESGAFELGYRGSRYRSQHITRYCKTGLVNFVLENYRNIEFGDGKISPIIFCIDYEGEAGPNPYPLTSEMLLSKTKCVKGTNGRYIEANRIITHAELRRAYKLCHDPRVEADVREVAQRTFKFVKVKEERVLSESGDAFLYELEQIAAPWEQPDFQEELAKRKSHVSEPSPVKKAYDWRVSLENTLHEMRLDMQEF